MDIFFSRPVSFDDLAPQKINSCGTVHQNHLRMPHDFEQTLKLKWGYIQASMRGCF
jgi:hypothetical protein